MYIYIYATANVHAPVEQGLIEIRIVAHNRHNADSLQVQGLCARKPLQSLHHKPHAARRRRLRQPHFVLGVPRQCVQGGEGELHGPLLVGMQ